MLTLAEILKYYLPHFIIKDILLYIMVTHPLYGVMTEQGTLYLSRANDTSKPHLKQCTPPVLLSILYTLQIPVPQYVSEKESYAYRIRYVPLKARLDAMIDYLLYYGIAVTNKCEEQIIHNFNWMGYMQKYGTNIACDIIYNKLEAYGAIQKVLDMRNVDSVSDYGFITPDGNLYLYKISNRSLKISLPKKCKTLSWRKLLDILYRLRALPPQLDIKEPPSFQAMIYFLREYGYQPTSWPLDVIKYYYTWLFVGFKGDEYDRIYEILAAKGRLQYNRQP